MSSEAPVVSTWPPAVRALCAVGIALLGAALLRFGWDRGPDALIDFGRELYVPWRLVEGDVLHRDIAWFNGPLAPWVLEAWMRCFGVSLDALQALDAVVIVAVTLLLVALFRAFTDDLTAAACAVVFLCVFAVAQQEEVGNYLFLAPYSHGVTLGFLLGLVTLYGLMRTAMGSTLVGPAVAGLGCGWAFLTKAEVFLASGAAAAAMLIALSASAPLRGRRARTLALFAGSFMLPLASAYLRLRRDLGSGEAWTALLGTWPYTFDARITEMPFYTAMRGSDDPARHLARMARHTALTGLFVATVMAIAARVARSLATDRARALAGFVVGTGLTAAVLTQVSIKWLLLPLPAALLVMGVAAARCWSRERHGADVARSITRLGVIVFAGALLLKVALVPMARQYGFVLAVPGTLLVTALLIRSAPIAAVRRGLVGEGALPALRAAGLGVILVFAAANLNATRNWFARKTIALGVGADRLWADGYRGVVMAELARDLDARVEPGAPVLVLPEGILLNYQLRRPTSTSVVNFMPPEVVLFGQERIIRELEANPPAAIALIRRPTDMYGYPFFGSGYGEEILGWVRERYRRVRLIEDEPLGPGAFGAAILVPR